MDTTTQNSATGPSVTTPWPGWRIALVLLIGAVTGALLVFGEGSLDGVTADAPMTAVGIATLCYLAAAVTGLRWMAWLWVAVGTVLIFVARLIDVPRWWVLALAGVALAVIGFVRRPAVTTPQTLAMLGLLRRRRRRPVPRAAGRARARRPRPAHPRGLGRRALPSQHRRRSFARGLVHRPRRGRRCRPASCSPSSAERRGDCRRAGLAERVAAVSPAASGRGSTGCGRSLAA